jgi:hypothetical protein
MASAQKFLSSPDESLRSVAKALLDVTAAGLPIKQAMMEDRDAKLDPYLDFWFGDSINCAEKLVHSDDEEVRHVAECLIDAEKAVIKSKESVLAEFKRLGIKPPGQ